MQGYEVILKLTYKSLNLSLVKSNKFIKHTPKERGKTLSLFYCLARIASDGFRFYLWHRFYQRRTQAKIDKRAK